jgi:hypothetical protein
MLSSPRCSRRLTANDIQLANVSRNASRKGLFSENATTLMSATMSPRSNGKFSQTVHEKLHNQAHQKDKKLAYM